MTTRRLQKSFALLAVAGLLAAACGGDDDDSGTDDGAQTEDDGGATDEEATDDGATDDDGATEDDGAAEDVVEAGTEAEGDVDTEVVESDVPRQQGGEIAIGLEAEIVGMRPTEDTCGSPCYNVFPTIYDKLMESAEDGSYQGWLLTGIEPNEDFTVWTAQLREGVVFHNGNDLTAQTIADMWPIQQEGSQSASQIAASGLANVEATGDFEVTYTLSRSNSAFPAYLARAQLGMVFDPTVAADLDAWNENPVGTGPYQFVSRDLDNETVVERNPNYWFVDSDGTQLPYIDTIRFRPIPDEGTRLDAVLSGTTQVAHTLRQGTIRDGRAARDDGADIFLYEFQGNNVGGGMFNTLVAPFDDIRVRRGLTLMNSQDNVIEALGGTGISLPGTQWFSPDSPWYSESVAAAWPQFDFEAGVAELQAYVDDPARSDGKAAGEPIDAELSCPPDPTLIAAMQVLEQTWTASGLVNVNLTNYDQQTHIDYALGAENGFVGSHTTHCWRVSNDEDPSTFLNAALAPPTAEVAEAAGLPPETVSPLNWSNYFDAEVFGNLIAATQTGVFEERYALYESVMMKLAVDLPIWFSGHTATALIADSSIKGLNSWELPDGTLGTGHPNAEGRWAQAYIET
ncbi:MAG: ABC transporter substrate-binding protein [Ilumatobacter sp.]|uniref:ABC transporter substrate-binding protein n=1 Tax=Ilumatobacter sp. TaxID=1967498 RepID=UPI00260F23DF|nr:ABC transporter substrate-binding protein [Ilumatobacter sp.]MDJ0769573.1 ABC transporter substrate-binding protein [Ilumatobacter sp.]